MFEDDHNGLILFSLFDDDDAGCDGDDDTDFRLLSMCDDADNDDDVGFLIIFYVR